MSIFSVINQVSFAIAGLYCLYMCVGYVLRFLRYRSLYKRFYDDAPIFDLGFIFCVLAISEIIVDGVSTDGLQFVALFSMIIALCAVLFPVCMLLFAILHKIDKWRDKLPEQ